LVIKNVVKIVPVKAEIKNTKTNNSKKKEKHIIETFCPIPLFFSTFPLSITKGDWISIS
jgi:hypothetical protein